MLYGAARVFSIVDVTENPLYSSSTNRQSCQFLFWFKACCGLQVGCAKSHKHKEAIYELTWVMENIRKSSPASTYTPSHQQILTANRCYFCMYSSIPKWLPSGSSASAHQPIPGISIFGTTILPPNASTFLL